MNIAMECGGEVCPGHRRHHYPPVDYHEDLRWADPRIVKYGIDELLPREITLVHGPGCPVCVTPVELINKAVELAARPEIIFLLLWRHAARAGTGKDLLSVKALAATWRIVYSPWMR